MATEKLEIHRSGRFEGSVTGDTGMDDGQAVKLLDSWLDSNRFDRDPALREKFTIRVGRREIRWC